MLYIILFQFVAKMSNKHCSSVFEKPFFQPSSLNCEDLLVLFVCSLVMLKAVLCSEEDFGFLFTIVRSHLDAIQL